MEFTPRVFEIKTDKGWELGIQYDVPRMNGEGRTAARARNQRINFHVSDMLEALQARRDGVTLATQGPFYSGHTNYILELRIPFRGDEPIDPLYNLIDTLNVRPAAYTKRPD
jgi:hypothetical protein